MSRKIKKCHIELLVSEKSEEELVDFLESNSNLIPFPKLNFHSTIYFSTKKPIFVKGKFYERLANLLPITINSDTYLFDRFGPEEKELVLRYNRNIVTPIRNKIIAEGIRQNLLRNGEELTEEEKEIQKKYFRQRRSLEAYPFNPHITLSKIFESDLSQIPNIEIPITLDKIRYVI